ncbi:8646_t:CDS:2 [Funneliformis geosporum]|uniref:14149_t:CDS:1 n=1 Tax=Funneliformis geosporum TaxID=1117311 RepID=A0A9W4SE04_9GLOM|nr:14149_t:CDS:2 [Funneliformis geosporum]CAI2165732.1 8646_t:CDS:2 [Funneliformis geosporum]
MNSTYTYIGKPVSFCKNDISFTCKEISLDLTTAVEILNLLDIVIITDHGYILYHQQPDTLITSKIYEIMLEFKNEQNSQKFLEKSQESIKECLTRWLTPGMITSNTNTYIYNKKLTLIDSWPRFANNPNMFVVKWKDSHTSLLLEYLAAHKEKVLLLERRGSAAKKVRSTLWNGASIFLREKDCFRLPFQCEYKWKNLMQAYNNKYHRIRFSSQIEAILGRSRQNSLESVESDLDSIPETRNRNNDNELSNETDLNHPNPDLNLARQISRYFQPSNYSAFVGMECPEILNNSN